jgi:hypothetical protein
MENWVMSGIGRQAKIPSEHQQQALLAWLETDYHWKGCCRMPVSLLLLEAQDISDQVI